MSKMSGNMKDYVPVSVRLEAFREEYPEGVLVSTRTNEGENGELVCFKAEVFRTVEEAVQLKPLGLAAAVGHAEALNDDEKIVEKCETVAFGRALANLGYSIKEGIASADEVQEYEKAKEKKESRGRLRSTSKFETQDSDESEAEESAVAESGDDVQEDSKPRRKRRSKRFA